MRRDPSLNRVDKRHCRLKNIRDIKYLDIRFELDPSCVLYLPFYKYGTEAQKIWDISGNNNHGIIYGASPAPYPLLSGVELVTNGTFTTDTDWVKGTGWTISGGVANASAGAASDLEQNIGAVSGRRYRLIYKLTRTAGSLTPQIGGVNGTARSANGIYVDIIVATGTGNLKFQKDASFAGTIDDVSVQEVAGFEGLGWNFDGVDDRVVVPTGSPDTLNITEDLTILGWYRLFNNLSFQMLARKGFSPTPYAFYMEGADLTLDRTSESVWDGISVSIDHLLSPIEPKWVCVAGTRSGTTYSLYVNGTLLDSESVAGAPDSTTQQFSIGYDNSSAYFLNGNCGEVLIFNRALSAQEIRNYYEATRWRYGS